MTAAYERTKAVIETRELLTMLATRLHEGVCGSLGFSSARTRLAVKFLLLDMYPRRTAAVPDTTLGR